MLYTRFGVRVNNIYNISKYFTYKLHFLYVKYDISYITDSVGEGQYYK